MEYQSFRWSLGGRVLHSCRQDFRDSGVQLKLCTILAEFFLVVDMDWLKLRLDNLIPNLRSKFHRCALSWLLWLLILSKWSLSFWNESRAKNYNFWGHTNGTFFKRLLLNGYGKCRWFFIRHLPLELGRLCLDFRIYRYSHYWVIFDWQEQWKFYLRSYNYEYRFTFCLLRRTDSNRESRLPV